MSEEKKSPTSPQLALDESSGLAVVLTPKQTVSLYKKSKLSGIPFDTLEEVYRRGYSMTLSEQVAYDRVNSFVAGGAAIMIDKDLLEDAKGYKNPTGGLTQKGRDHYNRETGGHLKAPVTTPPSKLKAGSKSAGRRKSFCARMGGVEGPMKKPNGEPTRKALALRKWNCRSEETQIDEKTCNCWDGYKRVPGTKPCAPGSCVKESVINEKRGLWDNIHAKRERIKHGSNEHMRKPGSKGAPSNKDLKDSQVTEVSAELVGKVNKARTIDKRPSKTEAGAKTLQLAVKKAFIGKNVKEAYTNGEPISTNKDDASNRFVGTDSLVQNYKEATPGQSSRLSIIKKVVRESRCTND